METKSAKGSSVLLFGLSFNLILTLAPYHLADSVIVKPTSTHSTQTGPQKKNNVAKRAVDDPSMCRKCRSACLNLNVLGSVSCRLLVHVFWAYLFCVITSAFQMLTDVTLR